jgi:sulfatase modifying factor 1
MSRCCSPSRALSDRSGQSHSPVETAVAAHPWVDIEECITWLGSDTPDGFASDGEGPARPVELSAYRISATAVTNAQFDAFVRATGYRTEAEEAGQSFVFYLQIAADIRSTLRQVVPELPWWMIVPGAHWRAPHGPGSDWRAIDHHPVVHVSWHDALAYCRWSGATLPTEAQWEHAARGGARSLRYPWGNELEPGGERRCNIWQGTFPNQPDPGWMPGTVPVDAFPANGFGLHNTSGNVWEWCADWFNADYHRTTSDRDPYDERASGRRSQRGGSFLCHASYCTRYRTAARGANTPESATSHTGFRVVAV